VGGGWAGVYAAWRLAVDGSAIKPADLCLFEARAAVGGRTYSVDVDNMTIDIGAYRFGKGMHLPGDLIVNKLGLHTACYEPSCSVNPELNMTLYRIVDAEGRNAGYATPIRVMAEQLATAGVRIFYEWELTGIYDAVQPSRDPAASPSSMLHFAGGHTARAAAVLLNMPRVSIERLDPASTLFAKERAAQILRNCTPCDSKTATDLAVKVYAIYDDPWWITKLGLAEGTFTSVDTNPPLVGRYHDGPVPATPADIPLDPARSRLSTPSPSCIPKSRGTSPSPPTRRSIRSPSPPTRRCLGRCTSA